jgi:uncharacterized protein
MAAEKSKQILEECGYMADEIQKIREIITEHSFSLAKKPSTIESAVLQDADKLDAIGAIGIARAFTCGCKLGSSYYDPAEPMPKNRPLNDKSFTIDHFFVKLLKLQDMMNTEPARREAAERTRFMKSFLEQFSSEIQA